MNRKAVALVVIGASMILAPTAASAARGLYSYEESDYSYDYKTKNQIQIADREDDGNWVYVQYSTVGTDAVWDLQNRQGFKMSAYQMTQTAIDKHRAVENIDLWPNRFGPWRYPR